MLLDLILVPLCAACDRLRGGWDITTRPIHKVGGVLYGVLLGYLVGLPYYIIPALAGLWWLGEKPGWGYPIGQALLGKEQHAIEHPNARPEKWQLGSLKNRPWASLVVRGAMWALPTTVLAYWSLEVLALLGIALAMPLGVLLEKYVTPKIKASGEAWRGGLMGLLTALI